MTTVGVVVPCRNEAAWIGGVLDALAAQDRLPDDVVIVDDRSTDGTARVVEEWSRLRETLAALAASAGKPFEAPMIVRVIPGPGRGIAAAVNTGVAAIGTEMVVRLDGHCRPAVDYLRRTLVLASEPGVGVAGGAWIIEPGAATLQARAIAIACGHPMGSGGAAYRRASRVELRTANCELRTSNFELRTADSELRTSNVELRTRPVDTVPFGTFRRALWQELGGLDERLRSNEDYEFNFRVRGRGWRVMLNPDVRCAYYARPTVRSLAAQYARYGWWKARMLRIHPSSLKWRQVIPAIVLPALVAGTAMAIVSNAVPWWTMLACYAGAILAGAAHAAVTRRRVAAFVWIAAAFAAMQLAWSAGFWASLVSRDLPGSEHRVPGSEDRGWGSEGMRR